MPSVHGKLTGPRFLELHHAERVTGNTLQRYRDAAHKFSCWSLKNCYFPSSAGEWDDLLVEFLHEQSEDYSRSMFATLVSSVEFFFPQFPFVAHSGSNILTD